MAELSDLAIDKCRNEFDAMMSAFESNRITPESRPLSSGSTMRLNTSPSIKECPEVTQAIKAFSETFSSEILKALEGGVDPEHPDEDYVSDFKGWGRADSVEFNRRVARVIMFHTPGDAGDHDFELFLKAIEAPSRTVKNPR